MLQRDSVIQILQTKMNRGKPISDIIEDLVDDLVEEKCVLLIGPEIFQLEEKSLIRYTHEKLIEKSPDDILYYYEQESLFLFKDEDAKLNAPRRIKRIYRDIEIEEPIFKKILEIPFHLIISLNPDTFLTTLASKDKYGISHQFAHFRFNGEGTAELAEPRKAHPLIYNLCGCLSEDESLVLDYEDLFQLLQAVLGPNGLPNKIKTTLRKARSFLFLGFDFEKWYSQLLLQLLTGERPGRRKLAINTQVGNNEARDFLLHQFKLEFLDKKQTFFKLFYEECKKQGITRALKKPGDLPAHNKKELKQLISKNEIKESIKQLKSATIGTSLSDQIILIEGRHHNWQTKYHGGTLYPRESEVILNQIREDLINIVNQMV